ncbi:hypothetical protein COS78_01100 [Candidatus Shapirobacteria bacterium CG06_land_8_20_14_3_00_40_12]|uniref:PHP domain-containing protein n=2 Tax=Candidatus Shapironibacteriota TaxID=1752721 RepID=A0A2M7TTL8_9BACT|nr:MAG: hypothetical protein COS78_01100 [Candidatus Shapirobacteria bacterium CG06_land_8_20_14_3_00_40_12]PIZ59864.1 MAG: hypothetical protein COY20_01540 [Candidatus Shapirobacteria bacterium CG_4_10_14_0_2_um_filter_40_12]
MITKYYPYILISALLLVAITVFLNRQQILQPSILGNLHTHTICSDGDNDYETMITAALKLNFKFIAITDHQICPEVINKCLFETRIFCIPGEEVTGNRTHLLALNITKPVNPYQPMIKQVADIHALGGLAIAAHPYLKKFQYTSAELTDSGLDAMECTTNPDELHPLPCIYTSDAHRASALGFQFLSCPAPIKTFSDLKKAIFSRLCSRSFLSTPNTLRPTSFQIN